MRKLTSDIWQYRAMISERAETEKVSSLIAQIYCLETVSKPEMQPEKGDSGGA